MGFFIAGHFATMDIGERFARQSRIKTFFDQTLL